LNPIVLTQKGHENGLFTHIWYTIVDQSVL